MNRAAHHQAEDKARLVLTLLIISVAIALIFLPMACGLPLRIDLAAAMTRPL